MERNDEPRLAVLIDADNNELTLAPGEVVDLKPGMGFSKKVRFKRGWRHDAGTNR